MPFWYRHDPLTLVGKPIVGAGKYKGECAALAQFLVPGLGNDRVAHWKRGEQVMGQSSLRSGTVIAIFDSNGRYVGQTHHNHSGGIAHTALYVRQSTVGIEIVHQFRTSHTIKGALVRFGGQAVPGHKSGVNAHGRTTPEDIAENYYVVELK